MILLVAAPSPTRTALASFLAQERLYPKTCATFASGMESFLKAPVFDLLIVDYLLPDGSAQNFMAELSRLRYSIPIIVIGAPLKAEAPLFRGGAIAVLGAGFSPRSAALQCLNLRGLVIQTAPQKPTMVRQPAADFEFGATVVSPEKRLLRPKHGTSKKPCVRLSRLQVTFLQTLSASPGTILDYESLFHAIWRRAYPGDNGAIRECVSSLRKQFNFVGCNFTHSVTTVYGQGYRYDQH